MGKRTNIKKQKKQFVQSGNEHPEHVYQTSSKNLQTVRDCKVNSNYLRTFFNVPKSRILLPKQEIEALQQPIEDSLKIHLNSQKEESDEEEQEMQLEMHRNPRYTDLLNRNEFQC